MTEFYSDLSLLHLVSNFRKV